MPDGSANIFTIKPGVRVNTPAFVAFAGPSGSGKTRSALELATGLAGDGKILIGDSEGNRALHYADLYKFDHVEWRPPFDPESNAALIDLAESKGYSVLIIDSESDEYEGEGGLQEIRESTRDEFWARTKARHKHALINRMRRAKVHIIFCLRAEERVKITKEGNRTLVETQGWQPICEKRFLYEVQSSFMFRPASKEDPECPGKPEPIKLYDIHAQFFPRDRKVSREAGRLLAQWCAGGAPAPAAEVDAGGTVASSRSVFRIRRANGECDEYPTADAWRDAMIDIIEHRVRPDRLEAFWQQHGDILDDLNDQHPEAGRAVAAVYERRMGQGA